MEPDAVSHSFLKSLVFAAATLTASTWALGTLWMMSEAAPTVASTAP